MTSKARGLADLGNAFNDGALSNRNLIINGAAVLDQRNNGSSVTPSNGDYVVDRWRQLLSASSKYSVQQVTDAPTGFKNSIKLTSSSAYTVPSDEVFGFEQRIEGNNIVQLSWGTSSAKSASLSFWVKSSLTGVLSGVVTNNSTSFPFDYTINAANTWEYKTVIIDGDTSGTWATGSSVGLYLRMMVGLDSSGQWAAASGSWSGTNEFGSTSHNTNIVGTNGATWQITGVQLEVGDTATPFEHRSYGQELALCQRYFEVISRSTSTNSYGTLWSQPLNTFSNCWTNVEYKVSKRAAPSFGLFSGVSWQNLSPNVYPTVDALVLNAAGFFYASGRSTGDPQAYLDAEL